MWDEIVYGLSWAILLCQCALGICTDCVIKKNIYIEESVIHEHVCRLFECIWCGCLGDFFPSECKIKYFVWHVLNRFAKSAIAWVTGLIMLRK